VKSDAQAPAMQLQFQAIGRAYLEAINKLKRGPRDLEEFKPFLRKEADGEAIITAIGNKQIVVIWGLNLSDIALQKGPNGVMQPPVIAYEVATDEDHQRYVLMKGTQVQKISDEQFRQSFFPKGHKPKL
jgi:hypothetical protein